MNRKIFILTGLLLVRFITDARIIRVGKQQQFHTISEAITASVNGDSILVEYGIYKEKNIDINKSITLLGMHYPVLDGEHKYQIISIKADHVTLKGFRIEHSGVSSLDDIAAIKIYSCREVTISDNIINDTFFGIYSQSSVNCLIENNRLTAFGKTEQQSGNGIHCWKSDSLRIIGNTVTGHRDGIYFEFVTNSVIWRNDSYKNMRYGLHFMFSNNDAYISNIFRNNGAGVSVMFTHGVKMFNNYFEENWGDAAYGIFLKEISDSYISGNKFLRNTSGIFMEGASRIRVEKNEFKDNGWAMKIQASCMDNVITNNNFEGNTFDVGTNGTLVMNSFDRNYWDKYEGYDLNRDNIGDIPYRPVSLYSMIVEKNPAAMMLYRSFMTTLLDKSEKILPTLTPENLKDNYPLMKPLHL
ncbi:MAG: nitrous oxide reductase family maturation protein NosD [Bacteroidetes bacterium]|nr:nitrous oxide reductase family maturation protein NosD [Bacteroidota bacterium]MBS1930884.1 nitrous oxide reductase family maturation protein NosD [Bacteroidota bacterium]